MMKRTMSAAIAAMTLAALAAALLFVAPARATVQVVLGKKITRLQKLVDKRYGAGRIDVTRDFIGARPGEPDPWIWTKDPALAVQVRLVSRHGKHTLLGWYEENGARPGLRPGASLFERGWHKDATTIVPIERAGLRFGFWLSPSRPKHGSAPDPGTLLFTNRLFNPPGPCGLGAIHPPFDGDVQALVFDVSRWTLPGTWLVCFEKDDAGSIVRAEDEDDGEDDEWDADDEGGDDPGFGEDGSSAPAPAGAGVDLDRCRGAKASNDYRDFVFEVASLRTTPLLRRSFGDLKSSYRR